MEKLIVQDRIFLTLLGGGSVAPGALELALGFAPILVAADGGAEAALAQGVMPEAIIGDLDSLDPALRHSLPSNRLHPVSEQDSTDFEKVLMRARAPLLLGVGFTGKRRDHELAAYHGLLRFSHQPCILLTESDVICLCPPKVGLDLPLGTRVSLFPMGPVNGSSQGLKWEIADMAFAPGHRIGTSNMSAQKQVSLTMSQPAMLLILPIAQLSALIDAITQKATHWPMPSCG